MPSTQVDVITAMETLVVKTMIMISEKPLSEYAFTKVYQIFEQLKTIKKNIIFNKCAELIYNCKNKKQQEQFKKNLAKYEQIASDSVVLVVREVDVIRRWTTSHHKTMQNYLWNPDEKEIDIVILECIILQHALGKLPKFSGEALYRLEPYEAGKYKEGQSFTNQGFTSTSKRPLDPEKLPGLSEKEDLTLILVTKSKNGVDISPFAFNRAKNQKEVLFPARTTFTVKWIEKGDELKDTKKKLKTRKWKLSPKIKRIVCVTEKEDDLLEQITRRSVTLDPP